MNTKKSGFLSKISNAKERNKNVQSDENIIIKFSIKILIFFILLNKNKKIYEKLLSPIKKICALINDNSVDFKEINLQTLFVSDKLNKRIITLIETHKNTSIPTEKSSRPVRSVRTKSTEKKKKEQQTKNNDTIKQAQSRLKNSFKKAIIFKELITNIIHDFKKICNKEMVLFNGEWQIPIHEYIELYDKYYNKLLKTLLEINVTTGNTFLEKFIKTLNIPKNITRRRTI